MNAPLRLLVAGSLVGLSFVGSCTDKSPTTAPEVFSVEFAKGGGGKGGGKSTDDPLVKDTDPPGAEQGTVDLQVRVLGSGFEHPAHVRFLMDGDSTGIATSDTADFVSGSELVTTITVAADAPLGLWDVEVELLSNRRKGIGIELFEVVADFFVGWTGVLSTSFDEAVTRNQDNRVTLDVSSNSYIVAANFSNTLAEYGSNLNITLPNEGVPDGQPDGNCWLNGMDDPSAYDPSVSNGGIAAILMNTLSYDGTLPRGIGMSFYKRELGNQHYNHTVGITHGGDYGGSLLDADGKLVDLSTNPVHHFRWGQNNPPSGDFLRVTLLDGDANKASTVRVFELRDGMVRITGRLGFGASDEIVSLVCDVHPDDVAIVTVQPAP